MRNDYILNDQINLSSIDFLKCDLEEQKEKLWQQLNQLLQNNFELKRLAGKSLQLSISLKNVSEGIKLRIDETYQLVKYFEIIRAEASSNYTLFYTTLSDKTLLTSKTLKHYTSDLLQNNFVKPHRAHLVNSLFIKEYCSTFNQLHLVDGSIVKVARRRKKKLIDSI